ncbi:peptide-methionine (S)-S-oxide reductase MsrA [Synechococcus sp. RedBA-s]|uniref:peptide-methionine (S)-S-oxide reductase MsrA n=1 Tax=Synechococcus sp. RedBA-s TaxID=2823741 RepID=UPI0020CDF28C|nr:peptide-methionine (S)-S-oxide reductase MsrA [Synechococcus sp. RedBA-s]MCP9801271.1 peptide-methionine (S)-S-oxide reductase MsrA [Synechococcus sp. RedBA-s]
MSLLLAPLLLTLLLLLPAAPALAAVEEAVLAGGCFWCLEHDLETLPGVVEAVSGFSGGSLKNPTYRQVTAGGSGHIESVLVRFDTARISLPTLLRAYWRNVDPLDGGGQFCDRGPSYRPVIFSRGAAQRDQAKASLASAARELGVKPGAIKVEIRELERFWPAEAYHQNYAERNKVKYNYYRWSCGRDRRLDQVWGSRARGSLPWRPKS